MDSAVNGSGSVYHHPDGKRDFTLRELACLQSFPTYHEFKGSYIKKQIANACPPSVATTFYQHLRQHMENVDGVHSGNSEPQERVESPNAVLPEFKAENDTKSGIMLYDETPSGAREEAKPDAAEAVRSIEEPIKLPVRQRTREPVLPSPAPMSPSAPSTHLTMSPETQPDTEATSPASQTPSTAQYLPTPSTGGRFIAGHREAALRIKRGRDVFEDPEGDGDDDSDGPLALQTPSKRPRTSMNPEPTRASSSSSSRTFWSLSDHEARGVEDEPVSEGEPMSEGADELGGSGPDDEMRANLAGET